MTTTMFIPQLNITLTDKDMDKLIEQDRRNCRTSPEKPTTLQASLRVSILTVCGGGFGEDTWGQHKLEVADSLFGNLRTNAYKDMLEGLNN